MEENGSKSYKTDKVWNVGTGTPAYLKPLANELISTKLPATAAKYNSEVWEYERTDTFQDEIIRVTMLRWQMKYIIIIHAQRAFNVAFRLLFLAI